MRRVPSLAAALVLLCLPLAAPAAEDPAPAPPQLPPQLAKMLDTLKERFTVLVPKDYQEALNLTEDQKKEIAKLQKELDGQVQKAFFKAMMAYPGAKDAVDKVRTEGNFDKLGDTALLYGSQVLDALRMRGEMEQKLHGVLTAEQNRIYDELRRADRQNRRRERRTERRGERP